MSKFVMVKFSDGDYRVYRKSMADEESLDDWNYGTDVDDVLVEAVAEGTDKDALIAMARIAREKYVMDWPMETNLTDRTRADKFP